jgi:hypothetical protein
MDRPYASTEVMKESPRPQWVRRVPWIPINVVVCGLWLLVPLVHYTLPVIRAAIPAEDMTCPRQLGQLRTAAMLYSEDNDDRMPLAANWADCVYQYTKYRTPFACARVGGFDIKCYGHAFASALSGKKDAQIKDLSKQPIVFDSPDMSWNAHGAPTQGLGWTAYLDGSVRKNSNGSGIVATVE